MRRAMLLLLAVSCSLFAAPAARAASVSAFDFATLPEFCGDQAVLVTKTLVVQGGSGTFGSGNCVVTLADKAQLKLINVVLQGAGYFHVDGGAGTKVDVKQSRVDMAEEIEIQPANGALDKGRLQVIGSELKSTTTFVSLSASSIGNGGRIQISGDSKIIGGGGAGDNVNIVASAGNTNTGGKILVQASQLDASGDTLSIQTHNGSIQLKKNDLHWTLLQVSAGPDGTCKATDNIDNGTPGNPCD